MWKLIIPNRVKNFIKKLPEKYRTSAISALEDIKTDPRIGKSLSRELKGLYSYQFGLYRIIYKIDVKSKTVSVLKINHRRIVYN